MEFPPIELPIVFVALALLAPLELYVFMVLLEPPQAIKAALTTSNSGNANKVFIERFSSQTERRRTQGKWIATSDLLPYLGNDSD